MRILILTGSSSITSFLFSRKTKASGILCFDVLINERINVHKGKLAFYTCREGHIYFFSLSLFALSLLLCVFFLYLECTDLYEIRIKRK